MRWKGWLRAAGLISAWGAALCLTAGCEGRPEQQIRIDGSSTAHPIMEAAAEEFAKEHDSVKLSVAESGTGGGLSKLAAGEIEIAAASRPIRPEEQAKAARNGLEIVELPYARDGIVVILHKDNPFAQQLSTSQLRRLWEPNSRVSTWDELDTRWPAKAITLYGPGTSSGTFEAFTQQVVGTAKSSRTDYHQSEDDNIIIKAVRADPYALGYLGFGYYAQHKEQLRGARIEGVEPTVQTIQEGRYPLTRKLYLYVAKQTLLQPSMREFLRFMLQNRVMLASAAGVPLLPQEYASWQPWVEPK